jgi:hypothetical protein
MFGSTKPKAPKPKPPKQYPPLTLTLEQGAVRMFRETLRIAYPAKLVTAYVKNMLLAKVEASIKASEKAAGVCCPFGMVDPYGFDNVAQPFNVELNDIEQFALRHMLVHGVKPYDAVRRVPNRELLDDVFLALDKHLIMNGGYDHSTSVENLSLLHIESERIQAYVDENIPMYAKQNRALIFTASRWGNKVWSMFTGCVT